MTIADVLNLSIPENFGADDDSNVTPAMEEVYEQLDSSVRTAYGASKFVIFLNEKEVVKIPFNGSYYYENSNDDDDESEPIFDSFCTEDYCAVEAEVYTHAVVAGVEKFFTKTEYVGVSASGTPIYVAERCERTYSYRTDGSSCSKDSLTKAKNMNSSLPSGFLGLCIDYAGEEAAIALNKFIEEEGIGDLHDGNLGFRANGFPVIIDYSDFNS